MENHAQKSDLKYNIAKEILQDHESIRQTIKRLLDLFNYNTSPPELHSHIQSLKNLISFLSYRLHHHFFLEENSAFLEETTKNDSHLNTSFNDVFKEHKQLLKNIDEINHFFNNPHIELNELDYIQNKFNTFVIQLEKHENKENELITEMISTDDTDHLW